MGTVRKRVLCQASADRVFTALITDRDVAEWMTADVEMEPWAGGSVLVRVRGWPELAGRVVELAPPRRLVLRWQASGWTAPATLTAELHDSPDGCWVEIVEAGWGGDGAVLAERDSLWSHWLIRLAAVVARG